MKKQSNKTVKCLIKHLCVVILTISLCATAGCAGKNGTIYESDTVIISREGTTTTIKDVLDGNEYKYRTVRKKRTETAENGSYTSVNTDNLRIEVFPHAVLRIYDKAENKLIEVKK